MKILEKVCRRLLREAEELSGEELSAKISSRLERAARERLAIYKSFDSNYGDIIILYSPATFITPLQKLVFDGIPVSRPFLNEAVKDAARDSLIGLITIDSTSKISIYGPCDSAAKVGFVAAKQGFGPLLYDIAISLSPTGKIMSSRDAVTDYARSVYGGMHRRPDIEKKPFVNKDDSPEAKTSARSSYGMNPQDDSRDCEVWYPTNPDKKILDYSFSKTSSIDVSGLIRSHDVTIEGLKSVLQSIPSMGRKKHSEISAEEFFLQMMGTAATEYFEEEYGKVPQGMLGKK